VVHSVPNEKMVSEKKAISQVLVAHTFNPCYSGGRDQEYCGSKPAQIVHETPSRENPSQKRVDGVAQDVGLEFKP
jgi:hypothetical protein